MSLMHNNNHDAWKQRVQKELLNKQRYFEKAYENGFDQKRGPWKAIPQFDGFQEGIAYYQSPSSFPIPYQRTNLGPQVKKKLPGFINDSSGTNPSDPNSLRSVGLISNGIYNPKIILLPKGYKFVKSNAPQDLFGSKNLNKGFYSFGSKTNIRNSLSNLIEIKKKMDRLQMKSENFRKSQDNVKSLQNLQQSVLKLDKNFQDIQKEVLSLAQKGVLHREPYSPNNQVKINDYTKNISQEVFSPGLIDLSKSFDDRNMHKRYSLSIQSKPQSSNNQRYKEKQFKNDKTISKYSSSRQQKVQNSQRIN